MTQEKTTEALTLDANKYALARGKYFSLKNAQWYNFA